MPYLWNMQKLMSILEPALCGGMWRVLDGSVYSSVVSIKASNTGYSSWNRSEADSRMIEFVIFPDVGC